MSLPLRQVTAVILAGGLGTRVQHLLPGLPKPMAPVAGKPFLEWVVRYLARQGVADVVISAGYKAEVIAQYFDKQPVPGVRCRCVAETEPLGTAGGFLHAVHGVVGRNEEQGPAFARSFGAAGSAFAQGRATARQGRGGQSAEDKVRRTKCGGQGCGSPGSPAAWLVLNGDSLVFADLSVAAGMLEGSIAGVLIGRPVPEAARYGTLAIGSGDSLEGFREKRPGPGIISAGVYLLRDELLREFPARTPLSFEQDVFPALTSRNVSLKVQVVTAPFLDIGTPESLPQAERFIRQNLEQFV